jgi:TonB family protein
MSMRRKLMLSFLSVMCFSVSSPFASQLSESRQEEQNASKHIEEPQPIYRAIPDYPREAAKKRIGGAALVEITVDENGTVTYARALTGDKRLRSAAVEAAKAWKFQPGTLDGKLSKFLGSVTFCFLAKSKTTRSFYAFSFENCCPRNVKTRRKACADAT